MKPSVLAIPSLIEASTAAGCMSSASPTPALTMSSATNAGSLMRRMRISSARMPTATMTSCIRSSFDTRGLQLGRERMHDEEGEQVRRARQHEHRQIAPGRFQQKSGERRDHHAAHRAGEASDADDGGYRAPRK